jgi:hypothetical protein
MPLPATSDHEVKPIFCPLIRPVSSLEIDHLLCAHEEIMSQVPLAY